MMRRRALRVVTILLGLSVASVAQAQTPPRFYLKTLAGANGVPVIVQSISGNANPVDPAHVVTPGAKIEALVAIAGYAKFLPVFDRTAMVAVLLPMGRVSADVNVAGNVSTESASGYGDPMIELAYNVLGPSAIKNLPDMMRYEPGLSIDVIADVAFPVGEYESDQALNLGQNRWYGRVGTPIVWQIGAWVPGRRMTVEVLPSLWWFTDNDRYLGGSTLETDLMFQLEGHFTRDLTESFWGSVDAVWITGGKSTVDGVAGEAINNVGIGATLGYQISENLQLTAAYMTTVNDSDEDELELDAFRFSLVYGWHSLVEGLGRLPGDG